MYKDDNLYSIDDAFWTDEEDYWKGQVRNDAFEDAILVDMFKLDASMLERISDKYYLLKDFLEKYQNYIYSATGNYS